VTMPIHPFKGMSLRVVREERDSRSGRRFVVVESPTAGDLRLPEEWTDQRPLPAPPLLDGHEVRLSARGLIQLAKATDDILGQALESSSTVSTLDGQAGRARRNPAGGLVHPADDDAARAARSVGHARPQSAASTRESGGQR
jgi:hypothetical protein